MLLLFLVAVILVDHAEPFEQFDDTEDDDVSDDDFDDNYEEEADIPTTMAYDTEFHTRIRRYGHHVPVRTLSVDEIQEVKGALKQILADRKIESQITSLFTETLTDVNTIETDDEDVVTKDVPNTGLTKLDVADKKIYDDLLEEIIDNVKRSIVVEKENSIDETIKLDPNEKTQPSRSSWVSATRSLSGMLRDDDGDIQSLSEAASKEMVDVSPDVQLEGDESTSSEATVNAADSSEKAVKAASVIASAAIVDKESSGSIVSAVTLSPTKVTSTQVSIDEYDDDEMSTRKIRGRLKTPTGAETELIPTAALRSATIATPSFDIPALLEIIANLTYDYESNLTKLFNETLQKYNIPTCKTPTTTVETTTETASYDFENATVVAKCFVCGLEVAEIPHNAYCADAFAGDFLPLVPVDPKARGHIARYRKYCRYLDVSRYVVTPLEPRSVFGRFTGGCSVRWTDLSGVYTQRACRNRRRAVMGKHFGSKRMAKLEMALKDVDNGCLVSPMASLLPLSRGISLYSRFHACVCTGNWCNVAICKQPWTATTLLLSCWFVKILIY